MKQYCIYYQPKTRQIIEILPKEKEVEIANKIQEVWSNKIYQDILIFISEKQETTPTEIKEKIGHSASTLHDYIKKLESLGLINSEISYIGNRKKIIQSKFTLITKNKKSKSFLQKFFQGLWVDSKTFNKIMDFLDKNKGLEFSAQEIATKTKIPVDEIEIAMSNWDGQISRTFKDFLKEKPFEKIVKYKIKK